jgi:hypothetical protein
MGRPAHQRVLCIATTHSLSKLGLEEECRKTQFATHQAIRTAGAADALGIDSGELRQALHVTRRALAELAGDWSGCW